MKFDFLIPQAIRSKAAFGMLILAAVMLATVVLAGCQVAGAQLPIATTPPAPPPTEVPTAVPTAVPPTATEPSTEAAIEIVEDPVLGPILVDGEGMTLYMFTKDEPDVSNCKGDCLVKWPPLLTEGSPAFGEGLNPALVDSASLENGTQIVTYNHMPLYYWWEDLKPGDTLGQGVGEVWYVVNPAGEMVTGAEGEAALDVAEDPALGPILVDGEGMTLYMFTKDEPDLSNCKGECLVKWPPLLTEGSPALGEGLDPALVGSAQLEDGTQIVTYNHMPLYYWWEDLKSGDTLGQDVGGVWYVLAPDGTVIMPQPAIQPIVAPTEKVKKESNYGNMDY